MIILSWCLSPKGKYSCSLLFQQPGITPGCLESAGCLCASHRYIPAALQPRINRGQGRTLVSCSQEGTWGGGGSVVLPSPCFPAGTQPLVCREAAGSLNKLQVSPGWVLQGCPGTCPRLGSRPPPPQRGSSLGRLGSISKLGRGGGLPAVSLFPRTYQKRRAFSSILSGQAGFWVMGTCFACLSL